MAFLRWWLFMFMRFFLQFSLYKEDICALADCYGISSGELLFANMLYELMGGCTSIICQEMPGGNNASGSAAPHPRLLHGRTMDWPFNSLAKSTLHFIWLAADADADAGSDSCEGETNRVLPSAELKPRRTAFQSLGWPGFVGVLTGVKPGRFSICLNARYPVSAPGRVAAFMASLFDTPATSNGQPASTAMADRLAWLSAAWRRFVSACTGGWQASSVIRHALEHAQSYEEAVEFVREQQLIVPSYLSIASGESKQGLALAGTVITHSTVRAECSAERLALDGKAAAAGSGDAYLVQTNDDAEILRRAVDASGDSNAPADFYSRERFCAVKDMFYRRNALTKKKEEEGVLDGAGLAKSDVGYLLTHSLREGGVRMAITLHACVMLPSETAEDLCLVATRMTRAIGA
jgi:hypothetical protein